MKYENVFFSAEGKGHSGFKKGQIMKSLVNMISPNVIWMKFLHDIWLCLIECRILFVIAWVKEFRVCSLRNMKSQKARLGLGSYLVCGSNLLSKRATIVRDHSSL